MTTKGHQQSDILVAPLIAKLNSAPASAAAGRRSSNEVATPLCAAKAAQVTLVASMTCLPSHAGDKTAPLPAGAPIGVVLRPCAAADLAGAIKLMEARLHAPLTEACAWSHCRQLPAFRCSCRCCFARALEPDSR